MSLSEDKAFIRITPAYAGRSDLRLRVHSQDEDHPRVRGEKERQIRISSEGLGSPPRTRGEAGAINAIVEKVRITPAYAGRSASLLPPVCGRGDHPRVRGEKFRKIENGGFDQGSPPRTRGEVRSRWRHRRGRRITPAYAGRSLCLVGHAEGEEDHPRVRGEKVIRRPLTPYLGGSPPRTRGEVLLLLSGLGVLGITPAYAGRRSTVRLSGGAKRDHPRVRGEKTKKIPYGRPFSFPAQGISFSLAYSCTILSQSFCAR